MKRRKKQVSENILKRLAILILLVIVISLSFICIGVIRINHLNHESIKEFNRNRNYFDVVKEVDNHLEVDTSKFGNLIDIEVNENSTRLYDICHESCNLRINFGGIDYYYFVNKNYSNSYYYLTIVKDNKAIIYNRDLGNSIVNLQLIHYMGYITLYNTISTDELSYDYDYALVVDSNLNKDEFSSLYSREMSFTNEGITYYYDICESGKAYKIKAIRKPFEENAKFIEKIDADYEWCNSVK